MIAAIKAAILAIITAQAVMASTATESIGGVFIPQDEQNALCEVCTSCNVPLDLALAVMETESGFKADAKCGECIGYMQIHSINFGWLREMGIEPTEPCGNIKAGVTMLGNLLSKYGDTHMALMAYNMGEGGAKAQWDNGIYHSTYSDTVVAAAEKYKGAEYGQIENISANDG